MWQVSLLSSIGLSSLGDRLLKASVLIGAHFDQVYRVSWLHWWVVRWSFFLATLGNASMLAFEVEGYSGGVYAVLPHLFASILAVEISLSIYTYGLWVLGVHVWLVWNFVTVHLPLWIFPNFVLRILSLLRLMEYATGSPYEALQSELEAATANSYGHDDHSAAGVFFDPLRKLSLGLVRGFTTMVWSVVVIGVSVFFFGTLAEVLLSANESDNKKIYFGDLSRSMFSLFQMLTLSGWSQSIIRKFVETGEVWFGAVMVFYILFSVLIVMNLLTAVIIEGAFSDLQYDEEQAAIHQMNRQARIIEEVKVLMSEAVPPTSDDPDSIKKAEFEKIKNNPKFTRKIKKMNIETDELDSIFELFDENHKETVNIEEICAGFVKLKSSITAKDIFSCVAHLKALTGSLEKISDAQGYRALLLPLERLEQELLPQLVDDIGEILMNIDRTLVGIQQESMGQLTKSIKGSLPPRPKTPPKPQVPAKKLHPKPSGEGSLALNSSSGFLGSESGESGTVAVRKRLRFADDN